MRRTHSNSASSETCTEDEKPRNVGWFLEAGMNKEQILCERIHKSMQSCEHLGFAQETHFKLLTSRTLRQYICVTLSQKV